MKFLKSFITKLAYKYLKLRIIPRFNSVYPEELNLKEKKLIEEILYRDLTMVEKDVLVATALACKYVIKNEIPGDFVECGVYRGGNAILAAAIFAEQDPTRRVWLFDTFAGNTEPSIQRDGISAFSKYKELQRLGFNQWSYSSLQEVKRNFEIFGLLSSTINFIEGDVRKTLNEEINIPDQIAVLRLDTDWFDSTLIELKTLYPRLVNHKGGGGVLIIDDYGYSSGARDATEEYFSKASRPLLIPVNNHVRIGVKI
jgi:O-methyltransferase